MEKHLLFFDIDGTLLHRGNLIYPADIEAIRAAKAAGHEVYINTGRGRAVVYPYITDPVDFDGYICGSTYVERHGEILHRLPLPKKTVGSICAYCVRRGARALLEGETAAYSLCGGCFHEGEDVTENYAGLLLGENAPALTKVTFAAPIPPEDLGQFCDLSIRNFCGYAEGIAAGYNKAFGMRLLCEKLGIPRARTVAFGDSENDLEMLRFAGRSAIMHSAPASLDAVATYRAKRKEDGIAQAIEYFGLGGRV